jgi:hypothetical protein
MARLGGLFPFPIANISEGGSRVSLISGQAWYPPAGQYLLITDANTIIQFWDAQNQLWRTLIGHSGGGAITVDGANYRVLNDSGTLSIATFTAGGSGLTNGIGPTATGVTASVSGGTQTGTPFNAQAAAFYAIVGGTVAAATVTQAGTGFQEPPLIVIDPPPPGGQQAYAHCTLTGVGGGIATIVVDGAGAGYTTTPTFWILPQPAYYVGGPSGGVAAATWPPPGIVHPNNAAPGNQNTALTGAQLTSVALTGSGTVTGLVLITTPGGYSGVAPTVAFALSAGFGGSVTGAAATIAVAANASAIGVVTVAPRVVE